MYIQGVHNAQSEGTQYMVKGGQNVWSGGDRGHSLVLVEYREALNEREVG